VDSHEVGTLLKEGLQSLGLLTSWHHAPAFVLSQQYETSPTADIICEKAI